MSTDAIREAFYKTTFTLKGRIFHPYLLATKTKKNPSTGTEREIYDVMFAWNPNDPANAQAYAALMNFINEMTGKLFPGIDPRAIVNPIKSSGLQGFPEYQRQDYKPNPEYLRGMHWVNAETGKDMPPTVVNEHRQPVLDDSEVYSGRNAVVNFQLYAMLPDPNVRQKKIGFGVNLNAVMILAGGDREGGRSTVDVNQVFGGFASDMGMGMAAPAAPQFPQAPAFPGAPAAPQFPQAPAFPGAPAAPQFPQAPAFPSAPAAPAFPGYPTGPSTTQQAQPAAPAYPGAPANFNPNGFGQY